MRTEGFRKEGLRKEGLGKDGFRKDAFGKDGFGNESMKQEGFRIKAALDTTASEKIKLCKSLKKVLQKRFEKTEL